MSISRRSLLAGTVALTAGGVRAGAVFDADAIVIGAGFAGLAAARQLKSSGKTCIVLEARERVGGRAFTETALGGPYEAGAMYLHWAERNPLARLASQDGIATTRDVSSGIRSFENGRETTAEARTKRGYDFGRLGALLDGEEVPDISIGDVATRADPPLNDAAAGLSRMAIGDEPGRISARDYARLWSGGDLLIPAGYSTLAIAAGRGLEVKLGTRATLVDWSGAGVAVETDTGAIRARSAIVTVPLGVLKAEGIRFRPNLPASVREALAGMEMGALSKIGLSFDFGKLDLRAGDIFSRENGDTINFDVRPFGHEVVVAIFGGDFARAITRSEREAVETVLDRFVSVAGGDARRAFRDARVHAWHAQPFSLGAYSHCLPGHADARDVLARPVGERVIFAGEATAPMGAAMTTGGAFLSGEAAAEWAAGL